MVPGYCKDTNNERTPINSPNTAPVHFPKSKAPTSTKICIVVKLIGPTVM